MEKRCDVLKMNLSVLLGSVGVFCAVVGKPISVLHSFTTNVSDYILIVRLNSLSCFFSSINRLLLPRSIRNTSRNFTQNEEFVREKIIKVILKCLTHHLSAFLFALWCFLNLQISNTKPLIMQLTLKGRSWKTQQIILQLQNVKCFHIDLHIFESK